MTGALCPLQRNRESGPDFPQDNHAIEPQKKTVSNIANCDIPDLTINVNKVANHFETESVYPIKNLSTLIEQA